MTAIRLTDGEADALVSPEGAELLAWRVGDRDLLWSPDARWWDRTAPVLFPIVGWAKDGQVLVDGRHLPMPVHGFAARSRFTVTHQEADHVRLVLEDDEASRAIYPFAFRLTLDYRLADGGLAMAATVENRDTRAMPYAIGFHPGFRWPLGGAREAHAVIFAEEERPAVPVIAPGGLFSTQMRPVPLEGRRLALSDALFAQEALCFLNARSRFLAYVAGDGSALRVKLEDLPHIALWSKPGAPFVCLEAWTGHGDPVNFAGEMRDKPSMRLLAPGGRARHAMTTLYEAS